MKIKLFATFLGLSLLVIVGFASYGFSLMQSPSQLDDASQKCLTCHDNMNTLIVGLDYVSAARLDRSLVSAASLDARLKLVDGKISCITCHKEYSEETHMELYEENIAEPTTYPMLQVSNYGSGLCLMCHRK